MAENKSKNTQKRNGRTYYHILTRIRYDSAMYDELREFMDEYGETSINFLICELLAAHFKCKLPQRQYTRRKRERLL